ncbi:hypothetical protein AB837_00120 [bacterium AB1]|nr:hypothetical protein AB837_00120 [bacterium AB1]
MNFNKNDENFLQLNVVQKSLTNILLSDLLFRNNRYRQSSLVYALLSIIHESTKKESLVSLEELSSYLSPNSEHRTFEEIILLICDEKNLDIKIYKRLIYTLSVFLKQHNIKNDIKNNVYINSIYQSWLKANLSLITSLDIVTLIQKYEKEIKEDIRLKLSIINILC